ncbi:unnamed protein product [Prorocentrum cordatum]|uniref:Uncharacterized protein n=1 Tax=Prorocentrum cordatum TaxID=2364126 RepID=A0ABN9QWC0_9DINO|nr:unnamed protein product [Polarella glacialis]
MTSSQLSPRTVTTHQAPHELLIELNSKLAEECEYHQALTKRLMNDNRMAVQSQVDEMRRTFQDMFDDHRKSTELVVQEHRRMSEQQRREVFQKCQQLGTQLERTMAEERVAVQGALQALAQLLERERAQRRADLQHVMAALQDRRRRGARRYPRAAGRRPGGPPPGALAAAGPRLAARSSDTSCSRRVPARCTGEPGPQAGRTSQGVQPASLPRGRHRRGRRGGGGDRAVVAARWPGGAECQEAGGEEVEVCDGEEEVAFVGSIWDAAVFIGCPQVGACAFAFTALMLLVNIGMQALFCLIVNDNLTQSALHSEIQTRFRISKIGGRQ